MLHLKYSDCSFCTIRMHELRCERRCSIRCPFWCPQTAGAAVVGALWPRCLHGSAPLLAEDGKDDVDAANQVTDPHSSSGFNPSSKFGLL